MKATNIIWDTDEENVSLPTEIEIPDSLNDDSIGYAENVSDYITNVTGYCHKGFCLEG